MEMVNEFIEGLYALYLKSIKNDSSKKSFLIEAMYEEYIREKGQPISRNRDHVSAWPNAG